MIVCNGWYYAAILYCVSSIALCWHCPLKSNYWTQHKTARCQPLTRVVWASNMLTSSTVKYYNGEGASTSPAASATASRETQHKPTTHSQHSEDLSIAVGSPESATIAILSPLPETRLSQSGSLSPLLVIGASQFCQWNRYLYKNHSMGRSPALSIRDIYKHIRMDKVGLNPCIILAYIQCI